MQSLHGRSIVCSAARLRSAHPLLKSSPWRSSQHAPSSPGSRRWLASLNLPALDKKWRRNWKAAREDGHGTASPSSSSSSSSAVDPDTKYVLPMFPYPSGTLHLGHFRVYTIADVVARYRVLKGDKVFLPMGWDAFGLPAENAAMERGVAPSAWTASNIAKMKEQLELMNGSWNWDREVTTSDPEFYKHTQKLFLMLHERGLAYQAEAEVNYDPVDKTVLANEQVDANGLSWRSGAKVEKRKLKQWFFKISEFRDALLQDLDSLAADEAWPERVRVQQKNWLGKSSGALIKFPVMALGHDIKAAIEVFTTRPDTLFGAQYIALASTHPIVEQLAKSDPELRAFLDTMPGLPPDTKVGYILPGLRAINPLAYHDDTPAATKESMPIYVAPYVLGDYGEGAVMGVPGHDVRDHAFWKQHHADQPVRMVLALSEDESTEIVPNEPFTHHGVMTEHSGPFRGRPSREAGDMMLRMLEGASLAERVEKWRLRDWLISRQRYWGTPIPIIHCGSCGAVPVPEEDLPVRLPEVDNHWADGKTGNALDASPGFVNTTCPKCKGPAARDTDTMDTFVDSSWYYARYADPHNAADLFSPEAGRTLPVHTYLGGIEHAILHLLYARFIFKFLATTPLLPQYGEGEGEGQGKGNGAVAEPFQRLITQGMVHGKTYVDPTSGRFLKPSEVDLSDPRQPKVAATGEDAAVSFEKMSKSKHNGVDPTEFIATYGADAARAHMLFQAPVGDVLNWDGNKVVGVTRWLQRVHDYVLETAATSGGKEGKGGEGTVLDHLTRRHARLGKMSKTELAAWDADTAVWRAVQDAITTVTRSFEDIYSLNTVVSDLMTLTNTLTHHGKEATGVVRREAASALVRMLAPIAPAFGEECWSVLHPESQTGVFGRGTLPVEDGSRHLLQPRRQPCAVQINGKVRGVIDIPPPPQELEGQGLREWMVDAILDTDEGRARFGEASQYNLRLAKRAIAVRGGKTINFVL